MVCTNCHSQINEDSLACPVCGKQLILDKAEASNIIGATVRNSVPASVEVVTEFMNSTADAAMKQIEEKDYCKRFSQINWRVIKVGINFSTDEHTITEWVIEAL